MVVGMPETLSYRRVSGYGVEHLVNPQSPHLSSPKNFRISRTTAYIIAKYSKTPVVQEIYPSYDEKNCDFGQ
jgi:hypothetical protein